MDRYCASQRQAGELIVRQSMLEAERSGQALSVILFDADLFKQINDTLGHLAGDRVLKDLARLAKTAVRESDAVSRWGGEEFLITLRDCPLENAMDVAEKLRQAVAEYDFGLKDGGLSVTISLGVAQFQAPESGSDVFARADHALYLAKENGRNCVEKALSPPSLMA